jgi:hypothetical protein
MRCKGVQRGGDCGRRSLPRDLPRLREQVDRSGRQCRHVQGLADRANAVRSAGVLVNKDTAGGEIQQSQAAQKG